ncbi:MULTISPECIES: helix-turn-helix domain-containing protein [Kerstersia]|jgi:Fis family transcriptional regulator|uniref:Putative Fis-like DNA-binding protein n=1 Tax=Kerstersia gyiorum TaxID=206506 RepID=A0A171KNH2_9BURK|nr:helix-turn-helix domain-containing protein [Kerstersia gyiorum]AZV92853.1 Fis family transcriptional regulator [Bordetella sp. J329]MCO7641284.1 DNA-binding protein [Pseudomonas sp. S 311-6]KAB0544608.1 Fis family transcriptional regulator [Kerstersia gyiorum]KKO70439.1 Fis family transcriptional regulator [Kerstersia gyiorum]MCH4271075.1 Fis family transcriptional regulator [Kerstersia gyiorum]
MSKQDVLEECVRTSLERYFADLEGDAPQNMWNMVMTAVERPVLEVVMKQAGGNQSRASEMLGITRNTLRKKLQAHSLIPN